MTREKRPQREAIQGNNERLEPKLVHAVDNNDEVEVKRIIQEAKSRDQCTEKFLALGLNRACDKNLVALAQLVLEYGANPNYASGNKLPGLLRAAESGRAQIADTFLRARADLHVRDKAGRTALLIAAYEGHFHVIQTLIAFGIKLDEERDRKGRTAVMTAAWRGHYEVVSLLLAEGANVDTLDYRQRNVLHNLAADRGEQPTGLGSSGKTRRRFGPSVVNVILQAGVNIDAQDELGRTALHWTCVTDNEELMKVLLVTRLDGHAPKARLDMTDLREKTPLHLAASHNRPHLAHILLQHGADIGATSDGGWTALHNACTNGSQELVQILLNARAEVNSELLSGKTPLHIAAEFGNSEAAACLLKPGNKCKRSIKDRLGNTPLLMAAQISNRDKESARSGDQSKKDLILRKKAIVEMLAPWNHLYDLSEDEVEAAERFRATIVDFGDYPNGNRVDRRSVYDVLYGRDKETGLSHSVSTLRDRKNMKDNDFSWIHLPVNSVNWCEALLMKRFIEEGAIDLEGYKALETSFSHQHKGQKHHSHFMRHMCQVTHRSTLDEDIYFDHASLQPVVNILDPHLLTSVPETMADSTADFQQASLTRERPAEAFHRLSSSGTVVPEVRSATLEPSHLTVTRQDTVTSESSSGGRKRGGLGRSLQRKETSSTIAASESSVTSKPSHRATKAQKKTVSKESKSKAERSNRPERATTPSLSVLSPRSCNIFMFMPYLHFEDNERRKEMQLALQEPETLRRLGRSACADEVLFRAHHDKSASFLHIRRTLDQFFYHNIDTQMRDEDQVVYRFQQQQRNGNPMIFMVDQLWIFVLGKDLVVTSFWQRWRQPRKDPLNVLEGIIEDINSKTREPVTNVYELAMTIAARCYGSFDRHRKGDDQYQFLDMFGGSIGSAMDREATLFKDFSDASEQASTWLRTHQRQEPKFVDQLLNIEGETMLLAEIKDIRDELEILAMVLDQQKHVLPDLKKAVKDLYINDRSLGQLRKIDRSFQEHERTITNPLKDIHRMDKQAERIYSSIRDLLDLKQKHANAFEARFARDQAVGTRRQGKTVMVFTVVTVIFLPLSFIAAFFAINIESFPHDPQTGNPALPLGYVSQYVFGVGLAISIPCIILALTVGELGEVFGRARRQLPDQLWRRNRRNEVIQEEHRLHMLQLEGTRGLVNGFRKSLEVSWNGRGHSKVRRSEESTWEMSHVPPPRRHLAWDEERGRRAMRP